MTYVCPCEESGVCSICIESIHHHKKFKCPKCGEEFTYES